MALGFLLSLALQAPDREGFDFFEKRIRPVLAEHCYTCHSAQAKRLKADLRLDTREGLLKGGASGPAIVPGQPEKSRLVRAIRHVDPDLAMPKEKLPDEVIGDFEAWVRRGAPDPRVPDAPKEAAPDPRSHWSFQAPREAPVPAVKGKDWVRTPVDAFVLAKLEEKGLSPNPPADPRTLLRRSSYDLTGLPPTAEEVEAFEKDPGPDAYEKAVDRLLASPRYGERWGRHWLDVARYADTKGDVFDEERRYPSAWTYRDWVVRAFNQDLPYDRFLMLQIAADRLVKEEDKADLAAMGFLTVGRRFNNNVHDVIDDRIDVVVRGLLGLSLGCARCHDHKYDPLPTKDYYSLYGVFASSAEPKVYPLLPAGPKSDQASAFEKELAAREAEVTKFLEKVHADATKSFRTADSIAAHLLAVHDARGVADKDLRPVAQKRAVKEYMLRRWRDWLVKGNDAILGPWRAYAAAEEKDFAGVALKDLDPQVAEAFAKPPATLKEVAERTGALLAGPLSELLKAEDAPPSVPLKDVEQVWSPKDRNKTRDLRKKVGELEVTHPGAPPRAMVLEDAPKPVDPRVFVRGQPGNRGDAVPRQFLEVLSGAKREAWKDGSGRLELARAVASPENPLAARVFVNRVWVHHFGHGLVRTPSDFGIRGAPPSHPELLDWLARRFVAESWSIKKLHRLLMLSSAYRQSSADRPEARAADPENVLLWRMHRERLDLEGLRDSILAVSGTIDLAPGGRSVDLVAKPFTTRRTIYGFVDRQNLPGMFRMFDFASPDTSNPQRYLTTVPQQALFMMNSGFVVEQARALAARPEFAEAKDPDARIRALYRHLFGRAARPEELALGKRYVSGEESEGATLTPWEQYVQVLLLSNEFAFVD